MIDQGDFRPVLHLMARDLIGDLFISILCGIKVQDTVFVADRIGEDLEIHRIEVIAVAVRDQAISDVLPLDAVTERVAERICIEIDERSPSMIA